MLTRLSVHCAERIVATRSSSGVVKSSSQCASGYISANSRLMRRARRTRASRDSGLRGTNARVIGGPRHVHTATCVTLMSVGYRGGNVNDRDVEVLGRAPLFEALDEEGARALRATVTEVHLSRGQTLFSEDQEGDRLYVILEGKIKLTRTAPDGRENLLSVLGPSEMF